MTFVTFVKHLIIILTGVVFVMFLFGCSKKYKLVFDDSDFKSAKSSYAEGETVTVYFDMIATDTDYSFYTDSEDVRLNQSYDEKHGYIFTFKMPAHDVKLFVKSRNSMEYDPSAETGAETGADPLKSIRDENILFSYYEATVAAGGESDHTSYVLYRYTDNELILVNYGKKTEGKETTDYCLVQRSVLDKCMKLVDQYKMGTGKWVNGSGLRGKEYSISYLKDGELKQVSSSHMPDNGREAFIKASEILGSAWAEACSELAAGTWFCPECGAKNNMPYCRDCGLKKPQ